MRSEVGAICLGSRLVRPRRLEARVLLPVLCVVDRVPLLVEWAVDDAAFTPALVAACVLEPDLRVVAACGGVLAFSWRAGFGLANIRAAGQIIAANATAPSKAYRRTFPPVWFAMFYCSTGTDPAKNTVNRRPASEWRATLNNTSLPGFTLVISLLYSDKLLTGTRLTSVITSPRRKPMSSAKLAVSTSATSTPG